MSWLDALLGRSRPIKAKLDALFALSTANITLETEFDLKATGGAAISFRAVSSGDFAQLQREMNDLLKASAKDSPLTWRSFDDEYGYHWIVLRAEEFSNLVATVHMINRELEDSGYGERLLATVFQFKSSVGANVYWIYNYKRGAFYPFVPTAARNRNNAEEIRLSSVMGQELPIEKDMTRWYALWGIPLDK